MLRLYYSRNNTVRDVSPNTVLELGENIFLTFTEDPTIITHSRSLKLIISLFSPIGTLLHQEKVEVDSTSYENFFIFEITEMFSSGNYLLFVEGDLSFTARFLVRSLHNLIYHYLFSSGVVITNHHSFPLTNFFLDIIIPPNISPIQQLTTLSCNYSPLQLITDKEGNKWLRFFFEYIPAKKTVNVGFNALLITRLIAYDLTRVMRTKNDNFPFFQEIFSHYTINEPYLDIDHDLILQATKMIQSPHPIGKALEILKFVKANIRYVPLPKDLGAAYAIENKMGDCTEFSTLFVSMCRALGIPARLTSGIIYSETQGWEQHSQVEFFANGVWWPIDPTLQKEYRYLTRNPECIVLLRGNPYDGKHAKEVRYAYDNDTNYPVDIEYYWHIEDKKNTFLEAQVGTNSHSSSPLLQSKNALTTKVPKSHTNMTITLDHFELEKPIKKVTIKTSIPEELPSSHPTQIPLRIINRNDEKVRGALRISFNRGGIYTTHLTPCEINALSNYETLVEIPSHHFLGKTLIEFIYQDDNGLIMGYEQKMVKFV